MLLSHILVLYNGKIISHILYSMLVSRVLYLANLTNSRKIAKLNPRESY